MIQKYRKKPVVIEAIQWNGSNELELKRFAGDSIRIDIVRESESLNEGRLIYKQTDVYVMTLEGETTLSKGSYLVKGINGEYYPCKPDIFDKTYEQI